MSLGPFFVCFKSQIRPRGTKSEAAAVIMNRGHKKNQATSVSSGPCPRGGVICEDFAILDAGRQREENTKEEHSLSFSSIPTKHPAGVGKKWFPSMYAASLGAPLSKIQGFYHESCWAPAPTPAPLIGYLILFPEALALSLPKKRTPKTKNASWDLTRPCPLGRRFLS